MELVERFFSFCEAFPGAELIDRLPASSDMLGKRADVFFENRRVVCEVKSLETDTSGKINEILEPYRESEEWPQFYGEWQVGRVLKHLRDGPELTKKIATAVSSAVADQVKSANRQIRATKSEFGISGSEGFLVMLNEAIDVLSPELFGGQLNGEINKKLSDSSARYLHLQSALGFIEAHLVRVGPAVLGYPALIFQNGGAPPSAWMESFVDRLQEAWAAFNRAPSYSAAIETLSSETVRKSELRRAAQPMPRHELWRLNYRTSPHLRALTDEALFERGREIMEDLAPRMLKGAAPTPREDLLKKNEAFAHFIEEIAFRGIDLRVWGPVVFRNLRGLAKPAD